MILGENELILKTSVARGQSYVNASNMSGMHSGLKEKIKEACIHTVYLPCAPHLWNIVSEYAASCCKLQINVLFPSEYTVNFPKVREYVEILKQG